MRKAGRGRIGVLRVRRAGRGLKRAGMRLRELGFNVKKGNVAALLPIGVFLVLYLGLGILFEYGMGISMGFYNIPIVVIFLVALLVACFQNRSLSFDDKLVVMGRGIGDKTIVTMILIFMAAGVFVGTVGRDSAESVAYLMLSVIPAEYSVAVLFVVSCFVSLSMGTSVGTITLITPIAVAVAAASGFSLPLCVASVMGGAMFGDNLSFISDTTIAACQGQGCQMKDKFRENFKIALPAALVTLVIILVGTGMGVFTATESSAIAVVYTMFLAYVVFRDAKLRDFGKVIKNALKTLAIVMTLLATAKAFAYMMTELRIPSAISSGLLSITDNKYILLLIINVLLLLLGCFMDMAPLITIMTPILVPVVTNPAIGMDPVHFGVVMIFNLAVGLCTPPVGSALFVGCAIGKTPIERTAKNMLPLYATMVIVLLLVTYVPDISLLLPRLLMGYGA